ncbi:MAG: hypothetical protein K2X82_06790 [Gemmataceae bacterium]|nr:hypothetical protein [Gemmataceae bacterium]
MSLPARVVAVVMLAFITAAATASPPLAPPPRPAPRLDADGDPLPQWAIARIGTGRFRVGPGVHPATLTPDGRLLLAGGRLFDPNTGKEVARPPDTLPDGGKAAGGWSAPDGRSLVLHITRGQRPAVRRSVAVWDVATRAVTHEHPVDPDALPEAFVKENKLNSRGGTVAVGPGGRGLLYYDHNHHLTLWTGVATAPRPVLLGKSTAAMWGDEADFTPDGRWVVQPGPTVRVWDATTGELVRQFPGPPDITIRMALAPDGRHAAFLSGKASPDEQARHETTYRVSLWDLEAGKQVRELAPRLTATEYGSSSQFPLRFSPDGATVVVLDHDRPTLTMIVRHWRTGDGRAGKAWAVPWTVGSGGPPLVGPDGTTLYLVSQHGVRVYDLRTGEDRSHPDLRTGWYPVGLTADGREVVTAAAGFGPKLGFWNRESGRLVREEPLPAAVFDRVFDIRYSPDARLVAVDQLVGPKNDRDTVVFDRATGRELYRLRGERCPTFGPDGGRLFTLPPDYKGSRIWDAKTGKPLRTVPCDGDDRFFFSPDGKAFGRAWRWNTQVFDADTGAAVAEGKDYLGEYLRPFPQGSMVKMPEGPFDDVSGYALGPGGRQLALVGTRSGPDHPVAARVLAFDTAGKKLVWEANPTDGPLFSTGSGTPAAFSPDGSLLAVGGRKVIVLFDAETGKEVRRFTGHLGDVGTLRFTPDGTRLVSADYDGTAWVWDTGK